MIGRDDGWRSGGGRGRLDLDFHFSGGFDALDLWWLAAGGGIRESDRVSSELATKVIPF